MTKKKAETTPAETTVAPAVEAPAAPVTAAPAAEAATPVEAAAAPVVEAAPAAAPAEAAPAAEVTKPGVPVLTIKTLLKAVKDVPGQVATVVPALVDGTLTPTTGEKVFFDLAVLNHAPLHTLAHRQLSRLTGETPRLDGTDGATTDVLQTYALDVAQRAFDGTVDAELRQKAVAVWGEKRVAAVEATAKLGALTNRLEFTFDTAVGALRGTVDTDASWVDLAVVAGAFLATASAVAPLVGGAALVNLVRERTANRAAN